MERSQDKCNSYLSWPIWLAYLMILAVGIPWYWPKDDTTLWFGMPAWVVVAIAASVSLSGYTAWLLGFSWPDEEVPRDGEDAA